MSERIRNYELIMALSPVANDDEASNILEGISGYIKEQGGGYRRTRNMGNSKTFISC